MPGQTLQNLFPVRRGELRLTASLFLYSFCVVGAFVAGRSARDALFLAHAGERALPWMYVASAVAVAIIGFLYQPLAARVRRVRLSAVSATLFALLFAGAYLLERSGVPWIYGALYVLVEVVGALTVVQFWTLTNELFNAREAKRLLGLVGSGGTLSNILVGLATSALATRAGTPSILILCALLLVGCAVAASVAGELGRGRLFARAVVSKSASGGPLGRPLGGAQRVLQSPHLRAVALLTFATFVTVTLVDFTFKVVASGALESDTLAAYFGLFYAATGALALVLQLFGTSRALQGLGVIGALSVLPSALGAAAIALVFWPVLWASTLLKGADALLRYTLNDATTQLLYLPVPPQARAPAKAFVDSVVKPLAIGFTGLALLGAMSSDASIRPLAIGALGLSLAWLAVVVGLRQHYIRSLRDNLRPGRGGDRPSQGLVSEGSNRQTVERALESDDPREVLSALELLPQLGDLELDHRVEALLDHRTPEVRRAALAYYRERKTLRFANSIFRRLDDPVPEVRAAAIEAFCALGRDRAVRTARLYLDDEAPEVRSAAIAGLMRYGGLDGVLTAAEALKTLIAHSEPAMRAHAAHILGEIGVQNFHQPLVELLEDPVPRVRLEAIEAAGKLQSPELILPLVYGIGSPATRREAIAALSRFGPRIEGTLAKVLANRIEESPLRSGVARVLGSLGTDSAVGVIVAGLQEPDETLRTQLYRSLVRSIRTRPGASVDRRAVSNALDLELLRAGATLASAAALEVADTATGGPLPTDPVRASRYLLASALREKVSRVEQRLFLLLAALHPDAGIEHIYAGIRDAGPGEAGRRRASAVELLDNLLHRQLKRRLLPLLDEAPVAAKLQELGAQLDVPSPGPSEALEGLSQDESAWVRVCALYFAANQLEPSPESDALVEAGLEDTDPLVREAALVACLRLMPERAEELTRRRSSDESQVVRRWATRVG